MDFSFIVSCIPSFPSPLTLTRRAEIKSKAKFATKRHLRSKEILNTCKGAQTNRKYFSRFNLGCPASTPSVSIEIVRTRSFVIFIHTIGILISSLFAAKAKKEFTAIETLYPPITATQFISGAEKNLGAR